MKSQINTGDYVLVTEPGMSMFSAFVWCGQVVDGKVKLKPGYNTRHFTDNETVGYYQKDHRGTAAHCRNIQLSTKDVFDNAKTYPL